MQRGMKGGTVGQLPRVRSGSGAKHPIAPYLLDIRIDALQYPDGFLICGLSVQHWLHRGHRASERRPGRAKGSAAYLCDVSYTHAMLRCQ